MLNAAVFMGPSSTHGAVSPQSRKPAIKVCVPHLPKGACMRSRSPKSARPRSRVIFVLVDVSSTKTRRCAVIRIKGRRREIQKVRASFTSARSCSAARSVFFIAIPRFAKKARQRGRACLYAALNFQNGRKFRHGDVRALLNARNQELAAVGQFTAARRPALLCRRGRSGLFTTAPKLHGKTRRYAEMAGCLPARAA